MTVMIFASKEAAPDFMSSKIMNYLKCDWSHIGIVVGGVNIYHSVGGGVSKMSVNTFLRDHSFVHLIDISEHVTDVGFATGWLEGNIGKDYSESQYLGFLFPKVAKWFSDGRSEMICSEFGARFIDECTKLKCFDEIECDFVDPKVLIETLLKEIG